MCQQHNTVRTTCQITCGTNPSYPGPETTSWSERHAARYNTYRPLNTYLSQYGSNVQRANQTVYAPVTYLRRGSVTTSRDQHEQSQHYSDRRQEGTAYSTRLQTSPNFQQQIQQRRQEGRVAYTTSHRHQTSPHHSLETQQRRVNTYSSTSSTVPPLIESSSGFTHYGTLRTHGQERRREGHGRVRRPGVSSFGESKRYRGRQRHRLPGEGFGEAYLRWSEYGVGETERWTVQFY